MRASNPLLFPCLLHLCLIIAGCQPQFWKRLQRKHCRVKGVTTQYPVSAHSNRETGTAMYQCTTLTADCHIQPCSESACPSLQIMQIMHFELPGVLTWALNIYHKGPEFLVTNKPKRGEFPSSIRYLPHLCNDLARGMFSLWSHSDSAKNQ